MDEKVVSRRSIPQETQSKRSIGLITWDASSSSRSPFSPSSHAVRRFVSTESIRAKREVGWEEETGEVMGIFNCEILLNLDPAGLLLPLSEFDVKNRPHIYKHNTICLDRQKEKNVRREEGEKK